jgi:hypothetical protein
MVIFMRVFRNAIVTTHFPGNRYTHTTYKNGDFENGLLLFYPL